MKVIQAVLMTMLLGAASLFAQETTPSLGECRTKGDFWLHQGVPALSKLPVADVYSRYQFMDQCAKAYPQTASDVREWEIIKDGTSAVVAARAMSFIVRHNLKDKFMQKDAAGIR